VPTLRVLSLVTLALILVAAGWQLMHHNRKSSPEVLPGIPRLELICDPGTNSCSLRPVKHWLERMAEEQQRAREEQQAVLEQAEHKRSKFLSVLASCKRHSGGIESASKAQKEVDPARIGVWGTLQRWPCHLPRRPCCDLSSLLWEL
jgi:hypothetical protein